jgi:ABC-type transporter Mla subunit MlaD
MSNVRDITGHVKDKLPPLTAGAKEFVDHLNETIVGLKGNLTGIKTTVDNLSITSATVRNVVDRNHGRIDEFISGLDSTIDNLRIFSQEISGNPAALLLGPDDSQKTFNAARQFADGARALSDAAADLRAALASPQPDPEKVQELYNNLNDQFSKFKQVEDGLWKQLK